MASKDAAARHAENKTTDGKRRKKEEQGESKKPRAKLYTTSEIAEITGLSKTSIRYWFRTGRVEGAMLLCGKHYADAGAVYRCLLAHGWTRDNPFPSEGGEWIRGQW